MTSASHAFEDSVWLFGTEFPDKFAALPTVSSSPQTAVFRDANYMIHHFGDEKQAHHLIFNAGEMGFLSAGHSHADFLHFELSLFGLPFLVDPGTYSYKMTFWRNYSRSTAAHNTVCIDDADQAVFQGKFGWESLPRKGDAQFRTVGNCCLFEAAHSCYPKVRHKRSILIYSEKFIICTDHFQTQGPHQYMYSYHFAPGIDVLRKTGSSIDLAYPSGVGAQFHFVWLDPARMTTHRGDNQRPAGWHFPSYGNRQETLSIELSETACGETVRHTIIIPTKQNTPLKTTDIRKHRGRNFYQVELNMLRNKWIYQYFFTEDTTFRSAYYTLSCKSSLAEWQKGNLEKLILFDATKLKYKGELIFSSKISASYIMLKKRGNHWCIHTPAHIQKILCNSLEGAPVEHIRSET